MNYYDKYVFLIHNILRSMQNTYRCEKDFDGALATVVSQEDNVIKFENNNKHLPGKESYKLENGALINVIDFTNKTITLDTADNPLAPGSLIRRFGTNPARVHMMKMLSRVPTTETAEDVEAKIIADMKTTVHLVQEPKSTNPLTFESPDGTPDIYFTFTKDAPETVTVQARFKDEN